jgi:cation diffusion facilitator CzcD-associated flavoprotein CzcO
VAIIGTGFGAIATAVRLQRAGFDDFVLIDRADDVGGAPAAIPVAVAA